MRCVSLADARHDERIADDASTSPGSIEYTDMQKITNGLKKCAKCSAFFGISVFPPAPWREPVSRRDPKDQHALFSPSRTPAIENRTRERPTWQMAIWQLTEPELSSFYSPQPLDDDDNVTRAMRSPSWMSSTTSMPSPQTRREDGVFVVEARVVDEVDEDLRVAGVAAAGRDAERCRGVPGRPTSSRMNAQSPQSSFAPGSRLESRSSARPDERSGRCSSHCRRAPRNARGSAASRTDSSMENRWPLSISKHGA